MFILGLALLPALLQSRALAQTVTYSSMVTSGSSTLDSGGMIVLAVSPGGALTGKLSLGTESLQLHGRLNAHAASIALYRKGADITVNLAIDPASLLLSGTVSNGTWASYFSAPPLPAYNTQNPAPQAGQYTLVLPAQPDSPATGAGNGIATMTVGDDGSVSISGRTGAGAPFSASSYVNADGTFTLFAIARQPQLFGLLGTVEFRAVPGVSDCDGLISWCLATSGSIGHIPLVGSHYAPPANPQTAAPFATGAASSLLDFQQGATTLASLPVTLSATTISSTSSQLASLTLDARTGMYSGQYDSQRFFGIALQTQSVGPGLLLTSTASAAVTLQSASTVQAGSGSEYAGATLTIAGSISAGSITLAGNNAYIGSTTISAGTFTFPSSSALLIQGGSYIIGTTPLSGSGALTVNGSTFTGGLTLNNGALTFSGSNPIAGNVTLSGSGTLTLAPVINTYGGPYTLGSGALTINGGVISAGITNVGGGTLNLNGGPPFTIGLPSTPPAGGTLVITSTATIPATMTAPGIILSGTVQLPDGTLAVSGSSPAGTVLYSGTSVWNGGPVVSGTLHFAGQP